MRSDFTQFLADLVLLYRFALVGGIAGDDQEARQLRQRGNQIIGNAVAEIFLLGVTTHVSEGQHGDGGDVG